jgi:hypothetical protein
MTTRRRQPSRTITSDTSGKGRAVPVRRGEVSQLRQDLIEVRILGSSSKLLEIKGRRSSLPWGRLLLIKNFQQLSIMFRHLEPTFLQELLLFSQSRMTRQCFIDFTLNLSQTFLDLFQLRLQKFQFVISLGKTFRNFLLCRFQQIPFAIGVELPLAHSTSTSAGSTFRIFIGTIHQTIDPSVTTVNAGS